jgi:hypothetical protein
MMMMMMVVSTRFSHRPNDVACYDDSALGCIDEDGNCVENGEGNDSELEEQEVVRMDLTDDLLHMVRQ